MRRTTNINKKQHRFISHPTQVHRRLRWADDVTITALSSWRFGITQFWNQKPGYLDEYFKIYKMSRIHAVHVKITVINTTASTPAEVVLVVLPYSDYSKTLAQVKQLPGAKIAYLSGSGGIDKVRLAKSATTSGCLPKGSAVLRDYQQSASESASTLALLPDVPVLAVYIGGASTEPTLRVFIECLYDIEFFEPEYPGSVAFQGKSPTDMTDHKPLPTTLEVEEEEEECEFMTSSAETESRIKAVKALPKPKAKLRK